MGLGILVTGVGDGTQAQAAGLHAGDVLIGYDDSRLDSAGQLIALSQDRAPDQAVTLHYVRNHRRARAAIRGGQIGVYLMDLADAPATAVWLHFDAGLAAAGRQRWSDADAALGQGLALAEAAGWTPWEARFRLALMTVATARGDAPAAIGQMRRLVPLFRELGDQASELQLLTELARIDEEDGDCARAEAHWERVLALLAQIDDPAVADPILRRLAEGRESLADRQRDDGDLEQTALKGAPQANIAYLHVLIGNLGQALDDAGTALEQLESGESDELLALGYLVDATVKLAVDRLDEAQASARKGVELAESIGNPENLARAQNLLGEVYLEQGHLRDALDLFEPASETFREIGERGERPWVLSDIGHVRHALGHRDQAIVRLAEAQQVLGMLKESELYD